MGRVEIATVFVNDFLIHYPQVFDTVCDVYIWYLLPGAAHDSFQGSFVGVSLPLEAAFDEVDYVLHWHEIGGFGKLLAAFDPVFIHPGERMC